MDHEQRPMTKGMTTLAALGCFTTLLLALLDTNIVSAVSWRMARDLDPVHGVTMLPWMVTTYALADCVVVPLYGKLADVHGAKRVYVSALVIFIIGSSLCGVARNMTELIVFRAVQGVGGGGLMSVTMVVLGMLFRSDTKKERDTGSVRVGMGGIMVGLGIALGPLAGALVAENLNWRWVFYINLPLALIALAIAVFALRLPRLTEQRKVDFIGAALIAGAASALLLAADWGGRRYAWLSPTILLTVGAGVVLLAGFAWRISTADEPLISLRLLRNRTFRIMVPIGVTAGMGLAGGVLYLSGYLQVGHGIELSASCLMTLPMAAGMMVAVLVARSVAALLGRTKYLFTVAGVLQSGVLLLFSVMDAHTNLWWIGLGMFGLGLGLGQSIGLGLQYLQNAVSLADIGVATTTQRFGQQLGTSVGFAAFGLVMIRFLNAHLTGPANHGGELDTAVLAGLPPDQQAAAVTVFVGAVTRVFRIAGLIALVPAVLALFIKEEKAVLLPTE